MEKCACVGEGEGISGIQIAAVVCVGNATAAAAAAEVVDGALSTHGFESTGRGALAG